MTYNYLIGFMDLLDLNLFQYIFFAVFSCLVTIAFIAFLSFKLSSNFFRIIYLLIYIAIWFAAAGLIGGGVMMVFSAISYVLIREFSGDYS